MVVLYTTHTRDGKIEDITTTQHHLSDHTDCDQFTIGAQLGQVIGFITPIHVRIPIMSFMHISLIKITGKCHKMPGLQFWGHLIGFGNGRANNNTGSLNTNRNLAIDFSWTGPIFVGGGKLLPVIKLDFLRSEENVYPAIFEHLQGVWENGCLNNFKYLCMVVLLPYM